MMVTLMEALTAEKVYGQPRSQTVLVRAFKTAAAGGREAFDAFVEEHVPEELRATVRGVCEETVFEEIRRRELLATKPSKSRMPHPWDCWHREIRAVLELLLGPPDGVDPQWPERQ